MNQSIPEGDWKYMKKLKPELLDVLCARINNQSETLLSGPTVSDYKKFLALFDHIHDSDAMVAECFDDWRRSTLFFRLLALQRHDLLKDEHIQNLSEHIQEKLIAVETLKKTQSDEPYKK